MKKTYISPSINVVAMRFQPVMNVVSMPKGDNKETITEEEFLMREEEMMEDAYEW